MYNIRGIGPLTCYFGIGFEVKSELHAYAALSQGQGLLFPLDKRLCERQNIFFALKCFPCRKSTAGWQPVTLLLYRILSS
jgi:hypothetical protein